METILVSSADMAVKLTAGVGFGGVEIVGLIFPFECYCFILSSEL